MPHGIRWAFNVKEWKPTKVQWRLCLECVQKEERDRCNRFCYVDDCKSSLVGQLLMRKAVSESLLVEYDKITFARTSSGKPYYLGVNGSNIFFNVSHNGEFCILASEINVPIGVDVMKIEYRSQKPLSLYFELMKKQFSSFEWDFISHPGFEREQLERFFRLWCLKESYVKAIGTGIVCDLSTLSFSCKTFSLKNGEITTDTKLYKNGIHQNNWKFEESFLNSNHCAAVALEMKNVEDTMNAVDPKKFDIISFEELMKNCKPFQNLDEEESFWQIFTSKSEK